MASNSAAWLTEAKVNPLEVREAPLEAPGPNQILVRNHATAINPIDRKLQLLAFIPLVYPTILGQEVAGEVVAIGSEVTRFKKGDRVIGMVAGLETRKDSDKAFQLYSILEANLASEIPDSISFESGVVLPAAMATASSGLFNEDLLGLQLPTIPARKSTGKTVVIWGGASSVGLSAIQLAVTAGYEVITTVSPRNFDYVKRLGASAAFDYSSPSVISDIVDTCKGKDLVGVFDCIGGPAWASSVEIAQKAGGAKLVVTTGRGFPDPPEGVTMKQMYALSVMKNEVGKAIFEDFLPEALRKKVIVPAPEPLVAGKGLESIQLAIDRQGQGVSAQKVVVSL